MALLQTALIGYESERQKIIQKTAEIESNWEEVHVRGPWFAAQVWILT